MKLKEAPKKIWFSWNDEDFKLFSILYSREIYNRVNHCLNWPCVNFLHYLPKKIQNIDLEQNFFYNFYTKRFYRTVGFLCPWLNLEKYNDKNIMPAKTNNELLYMWDFPIIEEKRWRLSQENQLPVAKFSKKNYKNLFFKKLKFEIFLSIVFLYAIPFGFTLFGFVYLLSSIN